MIEVIEINKGGHFMSSTSPVNHVYIIDVSGSMYSSLPEVRRHLKNSIGLSAKDGDTFTAIWFSGKGQAGVIFESVPVVDLLSMAKVEAAIDRFIQPIGLTAFADPMVIANALNLPAGAINNLIMMTDGYNNESSVADVMDVVAKLPQKFHMINFVEYGYYADRDMLTKMASAVGGNHLFADKMESYSKTVDDAVKSVPRTKNIEVQVNKAAKHAIFIYNDQIRIVPVSVVDGKGVVLVPEDVERVHSIVPKDVLSKQLSDDRLYLIMYYAVKEGIDNLVWNCLSRLGDVYLIELYQNAFTKQELSEFESAVKLCVLEPETARYVDGKDVKAVPNKNAKTIFDLLEALVADEAMLVTSSPLWEYNKTTRAQTTAQDLPRFIPDPISTIPMKNIVLSSERPNVSIQTVMEGTVEVPENEFGLKMVPSKITRNYTLIRDGIKNVHDLPVAISSQAKRQLEEHFEFTVIKETEDNAYVCFDLRKIPVINRSQVEDVDLNDIAEVEGRMIRCAAAAKTIKYLLDQAKPNGLSRKSVGMAEMYGEEAAKWLSSIGVRDYGFSPVGTTQAEATDEYPAIQLVVKTKGFSSIPTIKNVVEKHSKIMGDISLTGKSKKSLNDVESLVVGLLGVFKNHSVEKLESALDATIDMSRELKGIRAKQLSALILGRKWFGDEEKISIAVSVSQNISTEATIEKVRKMIKV